MIYKYEISGIQDFAGLNIHCFEQINDKKKSDRISVFQVSTEKFHIVIFM